MLDELNSAPVVDLSDVTEPRRKVDRQTGLLEHLPHEPFRNQLVVLDDAARERPEWLLARRALQYEHDLVSPADDRHRDLVRGTRTSQVSYDAVARTADRERARSSAAATNSRKSGAGRVGRDLNSGWNWLATNQG